jgi:3-carboxy-cis,cis-muconate cycloisomerase
VLPWHVQRDAIGELGGWLSLLGSSLAKLAQDVIWMSQSEVGEVSEAAPGKRGGSSSMPQKNNPIRSELIIAAARAVTSNLSALHAGAIVEHERGTHGWQLEWLSLSSMLLLAAGALRNSSELLSELVVHPERMRSNLASGGGLVLAEALVLELSRHMPRPAAQKLVEGCAQRTISEGRTFVDLVREQAQLVSSSGGAAWAAQLDWGALARPENYVGSAPELVDRALAELRAALVS